jgi:hypothetical protein
MRGILRGRVADGKERSGAVARGGVRLLPSSRDADRRCTMNGRPAAMAALLALAVAACGGSSESKAKTDAAAVKTGLEVVDQTTLEGGPVFIVLSPKDGGVAIVKSDQPIPVTEKR